MMNRYESSFPPAREARLRYLDADYQIILPGDYVRCALTGQAIKLDELRYWSVPRQEPYVSAEAGLQRLLQLHR